MTPPLRAARRHPLAVAAPLLAGLLSVRSALADYEPNAYVEPGTNLRLEYNLYVPNGPKYTHVPEGADVVGTVVNGEVKSTTSWKVNYNYKLDAAKDVPPTAVKYAGAGKI